MPTTFSYPDFTVGPGFTPDLPGFSRLAGSAICAMALPPVGIWRPSPCPEGVSVGSSDSNRPRRFVNSQSVPG